MRSREYFGTEVLLIFLEELCWGKAMMANTKPQKGKKEENERLRGVEDQAY